MHGHGAAAVMMSDAITELGIRKAYKQGLFISRGFLSPISISHHN